MRDVLLREVRDDDVELLYAHQADPVSARMADFPSRGPEEFAAHLARVRTNPDALFEVVEVDGEVVGHMSSFTNEGHREVGYWIDRAHWGRGIATEALRRFLEIEDQRPLYAGVSPGNPASARVLEKCGFVREGIADSDGFLLLRLD